MLVVEIAEFGLTYALLRDKKKPPFLPMPSCHLGLWVKNYLQKPNPDTVKLC